MLAARILNRNLQYTTAIQARAEPLLNQRPLPRRQAGRPGHVKQQRHPRFRLVGVLASRSTARGKAESEFGGRYGQGSTNNLSRI